MSSSREKWLIQIFVSFVIDFCEFFFSVASTVLNRIKCSLLSCVNLGVFHILRRKRNEMHETE